jgi:hypothetical protein
MMKKNATETSSTGFWYGFQDNATLEISSTIFWCSMLTNPKLIPKNTCFGEISWDLLAQHAKPPFLSHITCQTLHMSWLHYHYQWVYLAYIEKQNTWSKTACQDDNKCIILTMCIWIQHVIDIHTWSMHCSYAIVTQFSSPTVLYLQAFHEKKKTMLMREKEYWVWEKL